MKKSDQKKIKLCYVVSYKDPKYIRTQFLKRSFLMVPNVILLAAINKRPGLLRYFETIYKLIRSRVNDRPDVYVLGFRGVEIYWLVRVITLGKPLIYDEFINPYLWAVEEHGKFKTGSFCARVLKTYTASILKNANKILTDTQLQAEYSSKYFGISITKFIPILAGTDEEHFKPIEKQNNAAGKLKVLFYGTFLPLHGLEIILGAAEGVTHLPIEFTIIGGASRKKDMQAFTEKLSALQLKNVQHTPWVPFDKLPSIISGADICLGGPFGNTPQAQRVITGKTYQFLAMQKPVIIGRIDEDNGFRDKSNCLLVEQGNVTELTNAILWCLENRDSLDNIGVLGRRLYEDRFSVAAQNQQVQKLVHAFSD